ncbi:uncharacterized protein LOC133196728 [Saccostrea echinata]|uniref:uncharacterized protein LOC133196728 n=1 Tax=Saccostrea echinata TaxID=191078 RepID=UPI002A823A33|nr:uncharacterized protein LOC133196728 [Saccostrea echinata]
MLIKTYSRKSIFASDYKDKDCPCRRIWNAEDMKKLVQIGLVGPASHIRVHRPRSLHFLWWKFDYSYNHHYMVVSATTESLTIIHYAPKRISSILLFRGVAEIKEETVKIENNTDTLDFKSGVYLIVKDKYPKTLRQRSYCVKKARRRLGERQYSVFHNNCDSFVSWTLIGKSISIQAMEATGLLLLIGLLARTSIRIYRFVMSLIDGVNDFIDSFG